MSMEAGGAGRNTKKHHRCGRDGKRRRDETKSHAHWAVTGGPIEQWKPDAYTAARHRFPPGSPRLEYIPRATRGREERDRLHIAATLWSSSNIVAIPIMQRSSSLAQNGTLPLSSHAARTRMQRSRAARVQLRLEPLNHDRRRTSRSAGLGVAQLMQVGANAACEPPNSDYPRWG